MRFTDIDVNLMSNMKVTKIAQKYFLWTFWGFLVTIICDVKIDVNICEPHCVNLFFLWTSSIVQVFDYLTFDIFLTTWCLFDTCLITWAHGQHVQDHVFNEYCQYLIEHMILHMFTMCPCYKSSVKKMSSCQKDVKLSKRCQVVKKMSNMKKSNMHTSIYS